MATPRRRAVKPGPGQYNPEPVSPKVTAYTQSRERTAWEKSLSLEKQNGGPHAYTPRGEVLKKREPSWGFSRHEQKPTPKGRPGPELEHDVDNNRFVKQPAFGFGSERRQLRIPGAPFPGPDVGTALRMSERDQQRRVMEPGPGSFNPQRTLVEKTTLAFSVKGPSTVDADLLSSARKHNPGPGAYDTVKTFGPHSPHKGNPQQASPRVSIGTAARLMVPGADSPRKAPGPEAYKISDKSVTRTGQGGPSWSMPGRAAFDFAEGGAYL